MIDDDSLCSLGVCGFCGVWCGVVVGGERCGGKNTYVDFGAKTKHNININHTTHHTSSSHQHSTSISCSLRGKSRVRLLSHDTYKVRSSRWRFFK
jgi:hypothetical protein